MEIKGWKYYNHAVIPTTAPNEKVNMKPLNDGTIWKIGGYSIICKVDIRF